MIIKFIIIFYKDNTIETSLQVYFGVKHKKTSQSNALEGSICLSQQMTQSHLLTVFAIYLE